MNKGYAGPVTQKQRDYADKLASRMGRYIDWSRIQDCSDAAILIQKLVQLRDQDIADAIK